MLAIAILLTRGKCIYDYHTFVEKHLSQQNEVSSNIKTKYCNNEENGKKKERKTESKVIDNKGAIKKY